MDFGTLPSRYTFEGTVHTGGQGNVYVCRDQVLNRLVAIKQATGSTDQGVLLHEIRALSDVVSKHVVELYDILFDSAGSIAAIVLEYVSGDDLTNFAKDAASDADYLRTLYQISSGIADMHACGKVHRDIKHNNMKHDAEGIVKIFDFGLAKDHVPNATTMQGHGTDGYRAPELYATPATYGMAVDTYAFGALCWWLLDGDLPQELREHPPQTSASVPSISSSRALPADVVSAVDATLSVDPAARPTMAAVRDVLAQQLLFGRHRAHLSAGVNEYDLQDPGQHVRINIGGIGGMTISYDGLRFVVSNVQGDVFINNRVATPGQILPGASVITIGAPNLGPRRVFVTFDVSHPEVVL